MSKEHNVKAFKLMDTPPPPHTHTLKRKDLLIGEQIHGLRIDPYEEGRHGRVVSTESLPISLIRFRKNYRFEKIALFHCMNFRQRITYNSRAA